MAFVPVAVTDEVDNVEIDCTCEELPLEADAELAVEVAGDEVEDPCKVAVNLKVSPSVEVSLSRRGRKRFRELQANNPNAKIRFDRRRLILRVVATEVVLASVRRQLESLDGVHKSVPAAVWHELMRTRVSEELSQSLLLQLQQQSGCRIHIERGVHEVRIFGPDEETVIADKLLDELAAVCVEEKVVVKESTFVCPSTLQCISETCEVTIRAQRGAVMVYGRQQAVADAVEELQHEYVDSTYVDTDDEFDGVRSYTSSSSWSALTGSKNHEDDLEMFEPLPFSRASTAASDDSQPVQSQAVPMVKVYQASSPPESVTSGSTPPSPRPMMAVPSNAHMCQALPVGSFGPVMPAVLPVVMPAQPCLAMLLPVYTSGATQSRSPSPCPLR
mmetsp:Transcript_60417/g.112185  ORF Transcript_60417/g.112185 Transcript_60417/m.112185 type:complete len:388 (+) Transcript_60417:55-1218(+)